MSTEGFSAGLSRLLGGGRPPPQGIGAVVFFVQLLKQAM